VRALSRNPDKHRELADEVVKADLNRPETLAASFEGAHGVEQCSARLFRVERLRLAGSGALGGLVQTSLILILEPWLG